MKRYFICLANSFKYKGRCLAGIEIEINDSGHSIVRKQDGGTRWIRPVSHKERGELPIIDLKLFDIVEIEETESCPNGAHSENVFYSALKKSGKKIRIDNDVLNCMCDTQPKIFFNKGKAITSDEFQERDYSLVLVKVSDCVFYNFTYDDGKEKLRAKFSYNNIEYDLPVTDPAFVNLVQAKGFDIVNADNDYYFTISLGEELNGWHHKLIAGVIAPKF